MNAFRLLLFSVLVLALAGAGFAQPVVARGVGEGAAARAVAPQLSAMPQPSRVINSAALPRASTTPNTGVIATPTTPIIISPVGVPFGINTVLLSGQMLPLGITPVGVTGSPIIGASPIAAAAGFDLLPPLPIGGSFNTTNFSVQTPFGPIVVQQTIPLVTVQQSHLIGSTPVTIGNPPFFVSGLTGVSGVQPGGQPLFGTVGIVTADGMFIPTIPQVQLVTSGSGQ